MSGVRWARDRPHLRWDLTMLETVALRFRDFGIDTIEEHNNIAAQRGHVWWGWWNKPAEKTPWAVLRSFAETIEAQGPLQVFLVDSGNERLFSAAVGAIETGGLTDEAQDPPDPELVPPYYRERRWKVWFRLDAQDGAPAIKEEDPELIREFSYDEVPADEFVEDETSGAFNGKRVYSLREMLERRHRTMYFLRRARAEDPDHEVLLLAPDKPAAFASQLSEAPSRYLMVLSDLHFSDDQHAFALDGATGNPSLLELLDRDVRENFNGEPPAGILITGDLTWRGTPEEFEHARELVSRLKSAWDLDWPQIAVIPGNHDITHQGPGVGGEAGAAAGADVERAYREFLKEAFHLGDDPHLSMGRRFLMSNGVPVDVVALNSCVLEQEEYAGYGFVGSDQLDDAFDRIGWEEGREDGPRFRVLCLHHHVVPVSPLETLGAETYSLTLDAGELLYRALRRGVDLIVHGHQHQPFAGSFSRTTKGGELPPGRGLAIHGAGSVGVSHEHHGLIGKNAYSVLRFDAEGINVTVRSRSDNVGHGFDEDWKYRLQRNKQGLLPVPLP